MATNLVQNSSEKFYCIMCDYSTSRRSQYDRHLATDKHKKQQMSTNINKNVQKDCNNLEFECCNCGKFYKDRSGLWRHKQKCTTEKEQNEISLETKENESINEIQELKDFMKYLMKENSDMKNMMMKVIENGTHNTINTNTNSHNKAFNLNFFLNETCKDAMNIMDFVDSIQYQLADLEKMGEIGYVEGLSNIIVKNLNALDVTQRPIHCTDKKRETIYIKDQDKWEKDEDKNKIRKAIKRAALKNARLIQKFKEKHPDYNEYHSKYSTQYHKLIIESFGGSGDNDLEKEDKIIRNISKNIVVEK